MKLEPVPPLHARPSTGPVAPRQQSKARPVTAVAPPDPALQHRIQELARAERLNYLSTQMAKHGYHFQPPPCDVEPLDDERVTRWWEPKASTKQRNLPRKPKLAQTSRLFLQAPTSPRGPLPAVPQTARPTAPQATRPASPPPVDASTSPRPSSATVDPFLTSSTRTDQQDPLAGLWICFGAAVCLTELPDRSEGSLVLSGKNADPTLVSEPIGEVFDARVTFLDRQRWLPAPSAGAYPAPPAETAGDKRAAALLEAAPKNGLEPQRVHVPCVLHCKDSTQVKCTIEVAAMQIVGLRFVLPCISGPRLMRLPKKECCGTLLPPSKAGIRLRVDNAILFSGEQQMYHPVSIDALPGGKVVLNYMGLEVAPAMKKAYDVGTQLMVLLQLADDKRGTKLTDCAVLAYAGGAQGNKHDLRMLSRQEGHEVTFDVNEFNHCVQRLPSVTEYHTQIRLHCDKLCAAFKVCTDPLTKRRLMNVPADQMSLVNFTIVETGSMQSTRRTDAVEAWHGVRNARDLADVLMKRDEVGRICGSFSAQPLLITSDEPGAGKSWACEALQYFLAQPASEWMDEHVEGMAIVPLLLRVDWLERELGRLANERKLAFSSAHELLPWFISHRFPGEHDVGRRRMLMQALEMHAVVVIIDGLDEATAYSKLLLSLIFDVLLPQGSRVVVASRPHQSYDELLKNFVTYKLTNLTPEQQRGVYTLQVGKDSPRLKFFENILDLAALRNGHDAVYRETFGQGMLDLQVEQIPASNKLRVNGRPNGAARQTIRGAFIKELAEGTPPRSNTLKELGGVLTKELLHRLDGQLGKLGDDATDADLKADWFESNIADENLRRVALRLSALALKLRAVERKAAEKEALAAAMAASGNTDMDASDMGRLPPGKGNPCTLLWRTVIARTDELYLCCEEVQTIFTKCIREVVLRSGEEEAVELRFGDFPDPVLVHERGVQDYDKLFNDGVLGEANVLDVLNCRAVCANAGAVVAMQRQMLTEGGLKMTFDDETRPEDGQGKVTVEVELWRGKSRFVEIDPTRFRCFINTLLITVTIKTTGAPRIFKSFAELQVHHAKILAYDEANLDKHCYEYFRAMMPGVSELRRAAHIDHAMAVLDEASGVPVLISLLVSIFDTPGTTNRPLPISRHEIFDMAARAGCANAAAEHIQPNDILRLLRVLAFDTQRLGVPTDVAGDRGLQSAIARQMHKGSDGPPPAEAKKYEDVLADAEHPTRAGGSFTLSDVERVLKKQPRLRSTWQKMLARGLPFLQVLHTSDDDVADQWCFAHRSFQEGISAIEVIEGINSWSSWDDEKLAYRLMNEPSQASVWALVAQKVSTALSRRKPVWDYTFNAPKSALLWRKMSRAVRNDKTEEKKVDPMNACGVKVLASLLRAPNSLASLVLADDLSEEAMEKVGEALLANHKNDLRSLTCKPFSINTSVDAHVRMEVPPGTERRMCLQPGHITLLAGVARTMKTLDLCNNFAEAAGATALGLALPLSRSLTEMRLDRNDLGDAGAAGLARGLFRNASLVYLSVANNGIRDVGIKAIADALRNSTRTAVATLRLEGNLVGPAGSEAINALIRDGRALTRLEMSLCGLTIKELPKMLDALVATKCLTAIDLAANHFGEPSGVLLGEAVPRLKTLQHLDLSHNTLGNRGLAALAIHDDDELGLRHNTSLLSLNLAHNDFSLISTDRTGVVPKICSTIAQNGALQQLHLHGSKFDPIVAGLVGTALRANRALKMLDVRANRSHLNMEELHEAWADVEASAVPEDDGETRKKQKKREKVVLLYRESAMDERTMHILDAFKRRKRPTSPKKPRSTADERAALLYPTASSSAHARARTNPRELLAR